MKLQKFDFFDNKRDRKVQVAVYFPENIRSTDVKTVVFSGGYGGGKERFLQYESGIEKWPYENYEYLAKLFTDLGYVFVSIQHYNLGDTDGLKTLDPSANQAIVRSHLWVRGEENIKFAISEISKTNKDIDFSKFIIAGHSNGGDISKFFANQYPELVSCVISLDGRRCSINPDSNLKILSFEADDTSTDNGVLPNEGTQDDRLRENLKWVVIKLKNSRHDSFNDYDNWSILSDVKVQKRVCDCISWFLNSFCNEKQ